MSFAALTIVLWAAFEMWRHTHVRTGPQIVFGIVALAAALAHARTRRLESSRHRKWLRRTAHSVLALVILPLGWMMKVILDDPVTTTRSTTVCLLVVLWLSVLGIWLLSMSRAIPRDPTREF